jgi:3'-phosphoadenosine 5'-phosphosulfate sulfotransferase (PAPS reductase)/FAD synthetase
MTAMIPDLKGYDAIVVNSSAGKDSQAMLDYVVEQADLAGVRDRITVLHCDLGKSPGGHEIEWPGTKELAAEHAAHYALRFIIAKRGVQGFLEKIEQIGFWPRASTRYCTSFFKRDQGQKVMTALATEIRRRGFLEEVEHRGKWPSNAQRYCTSYFKRDAAGPAITALAKEARQAGKTPRLLQCFGFRAEESPRRRKMQTFASDRRISNGRKHVDVWLPIHAWTLEEVWARNRKAGTRHHYAYDRGMSRLSCRFCIFAPRSQLIRSARENPELFEEYVQVEERIGHSFRKELPLVEIKRAVERGEQGEAGDDGCWNM